MFNLYGYNYALTIPPVLSGIADGMQTYYKKSNRTYYSTEVLQNMKKIINQEDRIVQTKQARS